MELRGSLAVVGSLRGCILTLTAFLTLFAEHYSCVALALILAFAEAPTRFFSSYSFLSPSLEILAQNRDNRLGSKL